MTFKDIIKSDILLYGTNLKVVGAATGKILHNSRINKREHLEALAVCCKDNDVYIGCDLMMPAKDALGIIGYVMPCVVITVGGK